MHLQLDSPNCTSACANIKPCKAHYQQKRTDSFQPFFFLAPEEGGYDLYNNLPDRLWLRDVNGKYCTWAGKYRIFDFTQSEMVTRWLATLSHAAASGAVDGTFIDSGNLRINGVCKLSPENNTKYMAAHAQLFPLAQQVFPLEP